MSEKYLLPCECGKSVAVERPQAGTQVTCVCGRSLEVPTIRGFAKLERAEVRTESLPPIWGLKQGLIFLGLVIAVPAFVYGAYLYPKMHTLSDEVVKHSAAYFDRLTPLDSYLVWKQYSEGMPKNPSIQTQAVHRGIQALQTHIKVSVIVGILGLLIAASALFVKKPAVSR
jgi:hypothetical protein